MKQARLAFFGSPTTDYSGFVELLSSLSKGCTIVLSPYLTSEQLEYFGEALMDSSLSKVTVDMSCTTITEINSKTFYECTNITSVILPSSLETIGSFAFYGCTALTKVEIPDSVTTIENAAFSYCTALTTVVIGDGVETISDYAFYGCSALETVTIGSGVTTIGEYAFLACTSLATVYYNGTTDEWDEISISYINSNSYTGGNYYLTQASIICTDGTYTY